MLSDALANPLSVVKWGSYRVSVITSRCIRIEFNSKLIFEDRPSRAISKRNHPHTQFTKTMTAEELRIDTSQLKLVFTDPRSQPNSSNTHIKSINSDFEWNFELPTQFTSLANLSGFTIFDDSRSPVLSKEGVFVIRSKCEIDVYFLGYGNQIEAGFADLYLLCGAPELPPRFPFSMSFTAKTLKNAIKIYDSFFSRQISLGSVFLGANWHRQERFFQWDPEVFDQIPEIKKRNLRLGINIDILKGVSSKETQYNEVANFLKIENRQTADYSSKKSSYITAFVRHVMVPLENEGVDFFQINDDILPLNRSFSLRKTNLRNFILTKFCDFGCQKCPCSISEQKCQSWEDLMKMPNYLATRSNLGIIYELFEVSEVKNDDELCIRIFQFASLLPIVRMSISINFPWNQSSSTTCFILAAISLHNELEPLFYSLGYQSYIDNKLLIKPMYHVYPEEPAAFHCPSQFMIGDSIIAAPFVSKINTETNFAWNAVWMPNDSTWFDFEIGREYNGGYHGIHGSLSRTPFFVKAGAIVPTKKDDKIMLHIFPKGDGRFSLYDDDGDTKLYKKENFGITKIETKWESDTHMMLVFERIGDISFVTKNMETIIRLHNFNKDSKITSDNNCEMSGQRIEYNELTFNVKFIKFPTVIRVRCKKGADLCVDRTQITSDDIVRVLKASNMSTWIKQSDMDNLHKGTFFPRLTASSHVLNEKVRLLLLEELEDCGFHHFSKETGNDIFVVWNNSDSDLFTYNYKRFEPLKKEVVTEASGPVPKAMFFSPEKELTIRHRHLENLPTAETVLELRICDTLMFSVDFDAMK